MLSILNGRFNLLKNALSVGCFFRKKRRVRPRAVQNGAILCPAYEYLPSALNIDLQGNIARNPSSQSFYPVSHACIFYNTLEN